MASARSRGSRRERVFSRRAPCVWPKLPCPGARSATTYSANALTMASRACWSVSPSRAPTKARTTRLAWWSASPWWPQAESGSVHSSAANARTSSFGSANLPASSPPRGPSSPQHPMAGQLHALENALFGVCGHGRQESVPIWAAISTSLAR